ncbi:MAG: nuclear transport factor 2 family protein [Caulobacteraceae bacterium]|nr:nuclear transport factor 2 family protein [Caulobacteraceae bacterium]
MGKAEDEQAIRDLAAEYVDAVNRGDGLAMAAVYAPDGAIEIGGRRIQGMARLQKAFRRLVEEQREIVFQMNHSGLVKVEGDRAAARWWFSELKKPTGEPYEYSLGVYQDELARLETGWRFVLRRPTGLMLWRPREGEVAHFPRPAFLEVSGLSIPEDISGLPARAS